MRVQGCIAAAQHKGALPSSRLHRVTTGSQRHKGSNDVQAAMSGAWRGAESPSRVCFGGQIRMGTNTLMHGSLVPVQKRLMFVSAQVTAPLKPCFVREQPCACRGDRLLLLQLASRGSHLPFQPSPALPGHWEKPVLGAAADLPLPAGTWSISSCCQELSALTENNPLLSELCHEPKTLTKVVRLHLYKQALIRNMLHKHKLSKQSSLPL